MSNNYIIPTTPRKPQHNKYNNQHKRSHHTIIPIRSKRPILQINVCERRSETTLSRPWDKIPSCSRNTRRYSKNHIMMIAEVISVASPTRKPQSLSPMQYTTASIKTITVQWTVGPAMLKKDTQPTFSIKHMFFGWVWAVMQLMQRSSRYLLKHTRCNRKSSTLSSHNQKWLVMWTLWSSLEDKRDVQESLSGES